MKRAYGEVKYLCGANSVDCCVWKCVNGYTRTVELGVGVMCHEMVYYVIVFGMMMMEDPEWHRIWPSLWRGRTCDDVVNQLYARGSITGQTEMEMELTCDMEHNSKSDEQNTLIFVIIIFINALRIRTLNWCLSKDLTIQLICLPRTLVISNSPSSKKFLGLSLTCYQGNQSDFMSYPLTKSGVLIKGVCWMSINRLN